MKRIISIFIALVSFVTFLSFSAFAEPSDEVNRIFEEYGANCPYKYIKDQADVLTDSQENELEDILTEFRENNKFDLVIVFANCVETYDRMSFSDDYFDYNGYGYGNGRDGALLLVNVAKDKTYSVSNSWISTSGRGIDFINDDDISEIGSKLTPLLLNGSYYNAGKLFPTLVKSGIDAKKTKSYAIIGIISLIVSIIVAFIYCGKLKGDLKSVKLATNANEYAVPGSLKINRSYDHFLYANVSKTRRESKSSSTHTSSSGRTHGGGGF